MTVRPALFLLLVLITRVVFGQDAMSYDEMISLGRPGLIELATKHIESDGRFSGFDRKNFDRITVRADGEYIWVTFATSIRFVPQESNTIFAFTVYAHGQDGYSYTELQNPDDFDAPAAIYKNDNTHRDELSAILGQIGFEDGVPDGVTVTIRERSTFYEIEEMSNYFASIYKMRKSSGEIYDSVHEDLAIDEDDPTTEVK